ncbi:hypothetical protein H8F06_09495 [Vibrio fluvialis]|uniref:hypothetical protein n=1 Tax=Vibrio fluvialis TaxID=676 RepID=UPI00192B0372|nr:hypothetical protein [Vibrio fluvialis]MBL4295542.1 hypothetical protein [Vibrio fluvialis]MBY8192053.1 hypothetical protein [Vibrio fluvialis]
MDLRLKAKNWERLDGHAKSIVCGPFGSNLLNDNYVDKGIPMIRPFNLRKCRADRGEIALLEESFVNSTGLKTFGFGAVMFARVGEIGAGINLYEQATISPNIIAADLHNTINPFYVGVFSNTKYGKTQLEAGMKVVAQPTISTESIRAFRVPRFSHDFENKIADIFNFSVQKEDQASELLKNAENTLLETLGLSNWTPPTPLSYVRSSNEAFTAGRFDAEYFHPAKKSALSILDNLSDARVGDFFESVRDLWQPSKSKDAVVRNHDLTDALEPFLDPTKVPTLIEEIRSTKKLVQPGDLVVSRLRSYLREIAVVLPGNGTTTVVSTEYIVLRPKKSSQLAIEALLIYLRSQLPQIVFKWSQDGSNHPRFDENELLNIPIPRALISNQVNYVKAMQEMIAQRQLAVSLLEAAKRAVEIAIEDSEAAALAYLQGVV